MNRFARFFLNLLLLLLVCHAGFATHIRAGEILVENIGDAGSICKIHVIIYSNRTSDIHPGGGDLYLGDGTIIKDLVNNSQVEVEYLDNTIAKNSYTVLHQYAADTNQYTIGYREANRNAGIINMDNSVNTPFYVETTFIIDPPCSVNNTSVLSIPPVDFAVAGEIFIHNPGAWDKEGDSLSYRLIKSKQAKDKDVKDYVFPAGILMDSLSGEVRWPVPFVIGQYNIAFLIFEWRKVAGNRVLLSVTERDMQVIVVDSQDKPPEIFVPPDTCLQAGDFISEPITATDPGGKAVKIEPFGKVFTVPQSPAMLQPDSIFYSSEPVTRQFIWQTNLMHISIQPYNVHFKASSETGSSIPRVDFKTWRIKVSAVAPHHVTAAYQDNGNIVVNWDPYKFGAVQIQVNRRIAAYDIPVSPCITDIPFYSLYDLIANVNGTEISYNDIPPMGRFNRGARYCYRLQAKIPGCTDTESASSEEVCVDIPIDAPVITNVSVINTDTAAGKIFIRWTSSFDIDSSLYDPTRFTYRLQRAEGYTGKKNGVFITPDHFTDTVFTDTGINTEEKIYNYTVYLLENNVLIDSSSIASMVKLMSDPVLDKIGLQWEAEVPWSNNVQQFPYHYIFRDNSLNNDPEALSLIDSVNVNYHSFNYVDSGQFNHMPLDGKYCYYVVTYGSYGNPRLLSPLINYSQVYCDFKNDTLPPCPPELTINNKNDCNKVINPLPCESVNFYNDLSIKPGCDDQDLKGFDIYFSDNREGPFDYIGFSDTTKFLHDGLPSFKGCYKAIAIDFSGNQSSESEMACNDNCPVFVLPNVFTPNADGQNDILTDFASAKNSTEKVNCIRFIKEVHFSVFNRWGREVYRTDSQDTDSVMVEWGGKDNSGKKVEPGVYYYSAKIKFDVLDPDDQVRIYKGWIYVLY